jgi:hypothetical protein
MEAFYRNDKEIQEWIDLFVEKLFTVSLLSGNDADSEFFQGRQAVEKIALIFQEMMELPDEALMEGIRQLVEQRLPDSRVIENFPNFHELMNEMIEAGLRNPIAVPAMQATLLPHPTPQNINPSSASEVSSQTPSSRVVLNGGWTPVSKSKDANVSVTLRQKLWNPSPEADMNLKFEPVSVQVEPSPIHSFEIPADENDSSILKEFSDSPNLMLLYDNTLPTTCDTSPSEGLNEVAVDYLNEIRKPSRDEVDLQDDDYTFTQLEKADSVSFAALEPELVSCNPENQRDIDRPPSKLRSLLKSALKSASITFESSDNVEEIKDTDNTSENPPILDNTLKTAKIVISENKPPVESNIRNIVGNQIPESKSTANLPIPRRDPFRFNPKKATPKPNPPSTTTQQDKTSASSTTFKPNQKLSDSTKKQEKVSCGPSRVVRSAQIPQDGDRLAQILKQLFPNAVIRWNMVIGKNTFYAQVDNLLVYIQEANQSDSRHIQELKVEMKRQGWCLLVCQKDDLSFPRRLERSIRLALR